MKHALLLIASAPLALATHAAAQTAGTPVPTTPPAKPAEAPKVEAPKVASPPPATAAGAQTTAPANSAETGPVLPDNGEEMAGDDIVVTGQRERGSVPGDIRPEQVLRAGEIRSYGVGSISDLIAELAPQLGGARGGADTAPIYLLNGKRISGPREVFAFPPEALERVEILPPEAAQQLGYGIDQRVVNFVLRRRVDIVTLETQGGGSTDGDRYTVRTNAGLARVMGDRRLSLQATYNGATPVYQADRDITQVPPSRPFSIDGNLTPGLGRTTIDPILGAATIAGIRFPITGRATAADFANPAYPSDFGNYRTLSPATRSVEVQGSYTRPIGGVEATLSFELQDTASRSESGLAGVSYTVPGGSPFSPFANPVVVNRYLVEAGPLRNRSDNRQGSVGLNLNGQVNPKWRWDVISEYSRTASDRSNDVNAVFTPLAARIAAGDPTVNPFDRFDPALIGPFAQNIAESLNEQLRIQTRVNGTIAEIPGGPLTISVASDFVQTNFESLELRTGIRRDRDTLRQRGSGQANLVVPITKRATPVIGGFSLNGTLGTTQTSDFGSLRNFGYGFGWQPIQGINMRGSVSDVANAPSNDQLTGPVFITPNVLVFDFVTGRTVEVQRIDGGNPDLLASSVRTRSLGVNIIPFTPAPPVPGTRPKPFVTLNLEYSETQQRNQISSLPQPTAALQAAFPERYVRDAGGQLIRFDNRPINFAQADRRQLRSSISFSQQLGRVPERPAGGFGPRRNRATPEGAAPEGAAAQGATAPAQNAARDRVPAGGQGGRQGGFGGGSFGGGGGRGGFGGLGATMTRVGFDVTHTWNLENSILIRDGLPRFDQLDGDALTGNGAARHRVEFSARVNRGPYGLALRGDWNSGSFVRGGTARNPTDLRTAPLLTANLRAFTNFTPQMAAVRSRPWLNGMQVELLANNILNRRRTITTADGTVPLVNQPFLLDPIGRTLLLRVRKRI